MIRPETLVKLNNVLIADEGDVSMRAGFKRAAYDDLYAYAVLFAGPKPPAPASVAAAGEALLVSISDLVSNFPEYMDLQDAVRAELRAALPMTSVMGVAQHDPMVQAKKQR